MSETKIGYDQWLNPERLQAEIPAWDACEEEHLRVGEDFKRLIEEEGIEKPTVLEFGFGMGWLPNLLPDNVQYLGVDGSPYCVQLARNHCKHPHAIFQQGDARHFKPNKDFPFSIVTSMSFFKHFPLSEWDWIVSTLLLNGEYAIFAAQTAYSGDEEYANEEWWHTSASRERLERVIKESGHEIMRERTTFDNGKIREAVYVTKKRTLK